jgi:hypothetical protein
LHDASDVCVWCADVRADIADGHSILPSIFVFPICAEKSFRCFEIRKITIPM